MILCVWHVRRAWLKTMNRFTKNPESASAMYSQLGYIMKNCSNDDVGNVIEGFFNDFANEEEFLDYFHKNWVVGDKFRKCTYYCWCFSFCVS